MDSKCNSTQSCFVLECASFVFGENSLKREHFFMSKISDFAKKITCLKNFESEQQEKIFQHLTNFKKQIRMKFSSVQP